jgi:hypothetical protein
MNGDNDSDAEVNVLVRRCEQRATPITSQHARMYNFDKTGLLGNIDTQPV